jgi:hypothetical protein
MAQTAPLTRRSIDEQLARAGLPTEDVRPPTGLPAR